MKFMNTRNKDNRYGFLTTFSIIFAGVVGVGIFFKGQTVMGLTQSAMLMLIAWLLISIVAMGLAYAYIEISSSTVQSDKKEQGSLYKWSSLFLNKKIGAFVGLFYCFFYMPLNLIALALISSRMLINIFVGVAEQENSFILGNEATSEWAKNETSIQLFYILLVYIGAMMVVFFCISVNAFGTKFSKVSQTCGTIFKIFSLIAIIGIIFYGVIFDNYVENPGAVEGGESFVGDNPSYTGFFLALPAVMFTFDAFVQTGTLQSDTKSKNTFSKALISAMSIITILYLIIILGSGLIKNATGYDIPGLITTILGNGVFKIFILILITVSGVTAVNSWFVYLGRTISDLADHKQILNSNDDLQYQHKANGAYTHSYRLALTILSIYLLVFLVLDLWLFPYAAGVDVRGSAGNVEIMSTDLIVMLMYGIYGLIVFGGIRNRKHNRVKVDKLKGFLPVAIFSISILFIVIFLYFISIPLNFLGLAGNGSVKSNNGNFGTFWALPIDVILMLIVFGMWYGLDKHFNSTDWKLLIKEKIDLIKVNLNFNQKEKKEHQEETEEKITKENFDKIKINYLKSKDKSFVLKQKAVNCKQFWRPEWW